MPHATSSAGASTLFELSTPMHQVYDPQRDNWSERRAMGGGSVVGGSILTSTHEAFRPG
jgi:hypothetical protein